MFWPVASEPEQIPVAREVDWAGLSPRSQATVRLCWVRLLLGYTSIEIAKSVGLPAHAVSDALAQLREELRASRDARGGRG